MLLMLLCLSSYHNNTAAQSIETIREIETLKRSPDIKIGLSPVAVAVDQLRNKIYVADRDSNTVSVIDSNSGNVTNSIRVGIKPLEIIYVPETNKIYVTNHRSNTVSVIDGFNDKVATQNLEVGKNPSSIDFFQSVEYNKIYVANEGSGTVSVINGSTDKKIGTDIPVGHASHWFSIILNRF